MIPPSTMISIACVVISNEITSAADAITRLASELVNLSLPRDKYLCVVTISGHGQLSHDPVKNLYHTKHICISS